MPFIPTAPSARGAPRSQKSHAAILAAAQHLAETGGPLISLHMNDYSGVWGFGRNFETLVTRDFGLLLDKYDPDRDQLIRVEDPHATNVGTLVAEASGLPQDKAWARFFVLATRAQSLGLNAARRLYKRGVCTEPRVWHRRLGGRQPRSSLRFGPQ